MSSAPELPVELAMLLEPIPGSGPAGSDVRYAGDHERIQEARRADNPALPQGVWQHEPKRADWAAVAALAADTLRTRSKDLQVAAWLVEAVVQRDGFAGLAPALRFLRVLCERFWPGLHPLPEPGDPAARVAPLEWLNQRLPAILCELPLTGGPAERPFSWADHGRARRLETIRLREPKAVERAEQVGAVSLAAFTAEVTATPTPELRQTLSRIESARVELDALNALIDRLAGADAPGLGQIRDVLEEIGGFLGTTLRERPGPLLGVARRLLGGSGAAEPAAPPAAPRSTPGAIASRAEAYRQLEAITAFLAETEPHSPVVPLLERALAWGAMPLEELLRTLGDEAGAMPALFELLGLRAGAPGSPGKGNGGRRIPLS